jgi:hypothetical protein
LDPCTENQRQHDEQNSISHEFPSSQKWNPRSTPLPRADDRLEGQTKCGEVLSQRTRRSAQRSNAPRVHALRNLRRRNRLTLAELRKQRGRTKREPRMLVAQKKPAPKACCCNNPGRADLARSKAWNRSTSLPVLESLPHHSQMNTLRQRRQARPEKWT